MEVDTHLELLAEQEPQVQGAAVKGVLQALEATAQLAQAEAEAAVHGQVHQA